jgi:hypothetical protein
MKIVFFDFNSIGTIGHSFSIPFRKGMADAYWTICFLPDPGFPPQIRIQQVCSTLSGQLPGPKILLLRSVSLYGLCSTHLPRKPSRYRNLPTRSTAQTLSCGSPQQNFAQYSGRSQRKQRLVHLIVDYNSNASQGHHGSLPAAINLQAKLYGSLPHPNVFSLHSI